MSSKPSFRSPHLPIAAALLALLVSPLAADWLVTQDGARVETKGPWKVDGRRVIFTLPNGTLSAMRASEVDLEASEAVTRQALAPPAPPPVQARADEPRPEPVMVLTNKDIPQFDPGEADQAARPEVLPNLADREPVQVVAWKRFEIEDGVELRGTVRNTGSSLAANITVRAEVRDEDGEILGTGNAFLGNSSLVSGKSTSFRIVLPEVDDFAGDPTFSVTSTRLTVGGAVRPRNQTAEDSSADAAGTAADGSDDEAGAENDDEDGDGEDGDGEDGGSRQDSGEDEDRGGGEERP